MSWILLFFLIHWLRKFFLDNPNSRSSHSSPTPRGGGVVFVFLAVLSSSIFVFENFFSDQSVLSPNTQAIIPLLALPLAIVGFFDDFLNLSSGFRYAVQLLTGILLILVSPLPWSWLLFPLLLIVVTATINFTNFMDGLDGMVAGCMSVSICALAIQLSASWNVWALVGSLLGFLIWNWCPARVFMGDVGSTFLGAVFIGLVLQADSWLESLSLLLLATPLLADACSCVPRRLLSGQHVFEAHRLHLFQRLHQAGWSHSRVSLAYILATVFLAIALFVGGLPWLVVFAVVDLFIGFCLDQRVAVPFAVASRT